METDLEGGAPGLADRFSMGKWGGKNSCGNSGPISSRVGGLGTEFGKAEPGVSLSQEPV